MNKTFLLFCMVVFTLVVISEPAFTQSFPTDKGSKIIEGSFSFSNAGGELHEKDGVKRTSIHLFPSLSYFVAPGLALGGEVQLSGSFQEGSYNWTNWGAGLRLLYFIGGNKGKTTIKGSTYPFFDATALYAQTTTEYTINEKKTEKSTTSGTKVSFGMGICHMLSEVIGLTIKGGYTVESSKTEDGDAVSGNELFVYGGIITFLY